MIEQLTATSDNAGFPIVTWNEHRGWIADGHSGPMSITCRIMKDARTGELLFVASGPKRKGRVHEACPWESLSGFSLHAANNLYYVAVEQLIRSLLGRRGQFQGLAFIDGGQVIIAESRGRLGIHLNCADAAPIDMDRLHVTLIDCFLSQRRELVPQLCEEMYRWPLDDDRVPTFDQAVADEAAEPAEVRVVATLIEIGLLAAGGGAVCLLLAWAGVF